MWVSFYPVFIPLPWPNLSVPCVAIVAAGCAMRWHVNGNLMMQQNGTRITDRIVFSAI